MTGEQLAIALRRTTKLVKVIDNGRVAAELTAPQALELISRGSHWHGSGTKRKVSAIEFRPPRRDPKWQPCWRTLEAAILPPSIGWIEHRYSGRAA